MYISIFRLSSIRLGTDSQLYNWILQGNCAMQLTGFRAQSNYGKLESDPRDSLMASGLTGSVDQTDYHKLFRECSTIF